MKEYAIIVCAKAESERLPGKNLLPLDGKPLIQHTFDFIEDNFPVEFKNIWVVSDSEIILKMADVYGFGMMREPSEYINNSHNMPLMRWIDSHLKKLKYVMFPPTSPVRSSRTKDFVEHFLTHDYNSGLTVYKSERGQYKANGSVFMWHRDQLIYNDLICNNPFLYVDQKGFDIDDKKEFEKAERHLKGE